MGVLVVRKSLLGRVFDDIKNSCAYLEMELAITFTPFHGLSGIFKKIYAAYV